MIAISMFNMWIRRMKAAKVRRRRSCENWL
jgi:hypothetical protein